MERAARAGAPVGQAAQMRSAAALEPLSWYGAARTASAWVMTWAGGRGCLSRY
jgi:hypothetical protein